ncbi:MULTISPECIES: aminotransferase-like domain-containing protein [Bradyrhizobium]|uniref:aminotransferase-like domain-containing protein n=1 Tax=Bradyrhizobium TaxID=374 RepID=UPI0012FE1FD1|nr:MULTISPECIES: PLP-dependent aminotransferase family protein [Bradyrhizobium]MDI2110555.1 PLP-dependent aminotransferase family protein [Bradyrhizobium sp. Mp64]WLA46648.1 PLP-dependent aminotransferase family protein [Bradyrhizobium elkanii]WLA84869.1 PLP-dependent aminotransferase family protein [Bradyrhizobium elkanii]WLB83065.1 PLP-dependent aminotransferase family protein [Bradyrhizobium elkanii]
MRKDVIDLSRAVPPVVPALEAALAKSIEARVYRPDAGGLLRTNRPRGTEEDRRTGAEWISQRLGFTPDIDRMIVTNGTLNVLFLLLNHLVGRSGTLLTEEMTYPNMQALSGILGFNIRGIPMDREGLKPDAFEDVCRKTNTSKVLYTIPTVQNPTAAVMSSGRRVEIATIARRYNVLIIEDDAQALMVEDAGAPIATLAPELTWYVMGLAKTVVMGMRVAFLMAPRAGDATALMEKFGKMSMWFVAALHAELAQAFVANRTAHEATTSIRKIAASRRRIAADVLQRPDLAGGPLGLHVWVPTRPDARSLASEALAAGVLVRPGFQFAAEPVPTGAMQGLRVSYCETRNEDDLRRGLAILAKIISARDAWPDTAATSGH